MIDIAKLVGDWDTEQETIQLHAGINNPGIKPNPRRFSMILSVPPSAGGIALTLNSNLPIDFNEGITLVYPDVLMIDYHKHGPLVGASWTILCPAAFPPYLVVVSLVQSAAGAS